MSTQLQVAVGQCSDKGRKDVNQDFHGACIPEEPSLSSKGIAIALADGISSSAVSQIASETSVTEFLEDYYCTSEAWTVKTSAQVLCSQLTLGFIHKQDKANIVTIKTGAMSAHLVQ